MEAISRRLEARSRSRAGSHVAHHGVEALESRLCLAGLSLPFMAANFSFLDLSLTQQPPSPLNRRTLELALPTDFELDPTQVVYNPAGSASASLSWPELKQVTRNDPGGGVAVGGAFAELGVTVEMRRFDPATTLDEAMTILERNYGPPAVEISPAQSVSAAWSVTGGGLGGREVAIEARTARFRVPGTSDANYVTESMTLDYLIPWGFDPNQHAEFVDVQVAVTSALSTTDASILPLSQVGMETTGFGSLEEYHGTVLTQAAGNVKFSGAIPDLLFLYDFSGASTRRPAVVPYVNQYEQPTLPVRYGVHCGNACGPSSLKMALSEAVVGTTIKDVYDNTIGVGAPDPEWPGELSQRFEWQPGATYAKNKLGPSHSVLARDGDSWSNIDANLNANRPVVIGTKFGEGTELGTGHVMLLLGVGKNPQIKAGIAQLYGSGDYYIVADPAGNFFGDPNTGGFNRGHYGTVPGLRALAKGINYGGWFAVYPKSQLLNWVSEMRTLIIDPVKPALKAAAHSPVSVVVTDPLGRRSGILPDGSVLDEIPDGGYEVWVGEEFEGDGPTYSPDKEKGVVLTDPAQGTYQVQLVGTGTGPYRLDIDSMQPGAGTETTSYAGTITPGEIKNYSFSFPGTGTPQLQQVFANSTGWSPAFRQYMQTTGTGDAALGYRVNSGDTLPWVNVDRLVMRFDGPLPERALPAHVTIDGARADYQAVPTALDPRSILLTFDRPLAADRLRLVDNALGGALDFRFNALPGDADRSGSVLANDFSDVKKKFFKSTTNPGAGDTGYTVFHDVDGNGSIVAGDFSEVKKRFFNTLPAPGLTASAGALLDEPLRAARPTHLIDEVSP